VESFDPKVGYYTRQRFVSLLYLTDDTREIARAASEAIVPIFKQGLRYKKCGVGLLDVRTRKHEQHDLFTPSQADRSRKLMVVLDRINQRYGKQTVQIASTGITPEWAMKRDYMSPKYTTRWCDVVIAK
jgi:DNA polymerase V